MFGQNEPVTVRDAIKKILAKIFDYLLPLNTSETGAKILILAPVSLV